VPGADIDGGAANGHASCKLQELWEEVVPMLLAQADEVIDKAMMPTMSGAQA
jgi:hypothetical protein